MFRRAFLYLCLLLTVLSTAAWVHSWSRKELSWLRKPAPRTVPVGDSLILLNSWRGTIDVSMSRSVGEDHHNGVDQRTGWKTFGPVSYSYAIFSRENWFGTRRVRCDRARIDYWLPTLLFAVYPAVALIHKPVRRWRRRRGGLCIACGYDLRGSVSEQCSECGTER